MKRRLLLRFLQESLILFLPLLLSCHQEIHSLRFEADYKVIIDIHPVLYFLTVQLHSCPVKRPDTVIFSPKKSLQSDNREL